MANFKDIIDMISKKKAPIPSKEFWKGFDRELGEKLDAVNSRKLNRRYGFSEKLNDALSVFLRPKPVLVTATLIVAINLAVFSLANRSTYLTSVAFLSNDDLAEELVLTGELASGENIVDFWAR